MNESDVAAALSNCRKDGCYVAKWCEKSNSSRKSAVVVQERVSLLGSTDNLKLTCWNCQGFSYSLALRSLIVVFQHWLWLYDLYKLGEVHREYEPISKSDGRLNPERDASGSFG